MNGIYQKCSIFAVENKGTMKTHKLLWDNDVNEDCLVVLQTSLHAHQVAFLLNQTLETRFVRRHTDIYDNDSNASFALFQWNKTDEEIWYVIANQSKEESQNEIGLFRSVEKTHFLIKELWKINYLLMICNPSENFYKDNILRKLRENPLWSFLYEVDINSLKSKHKLIF